MPEQPVPTTHRLADGTLVRIRPIRSDDRDRLRNGFARLSAESKYRRFFAAPATLSESTLDYLTGTDGWNHLALGAELAAPGADTSYGLGIARFVRLRTIRRRPKRRSPSSTSCSTVVSAGSSSVS